MSELQKRAGEAMARAVLDAKQAKTDIEAHFPPGTTVNVDPQDDGALVSVAFEREHLFASVEPDGIVMQFLRTGSTEPEEDEPDE